MTWEGFFLPGICSFTPIFSLQYHVMNIAMNSYSSLFTPTHLETLKSQPETAINWGNTNLISWRLTADTHLLFAKSGGSQLEMRSLLLSPSVLNWWTKHYSYCTFHTQNAAQQQKTPKHGFKPCTRTKRRKLVLLELKRN